MQDTTWIIWTTKQLPNWFVVPHSAQYSKKEQLCI